MKLKVKRDIFVDHDQNHFSKGDVFEYDDTNYMLNIFYKKRIAENDVEKFVEETKKTQKININKKEEK